MRELKIVLVTAVCSALAACTVTKMLDRKASKVFEANGLERRTFTDAAGPHFVWASAAMERGEAKPKLMLVHGITSSGNMWASNVDTLSKAYDLIVPDLIGHGRSTAQWKGNSVDAQVAHLSLLLDSLHVNEPVFVVGNSYGGAMVANFAEQYPERARALVIYDGPASDYTAAIADSVARSVGATDITDLFSPENPEEQYRLFSLVTYEPPKIPGFALKQLNKSMRAHSAVYLGLLRDLLEREGQYATKRYTWPMPVFVIWGEGDRLIPLATGRGIARRNELPADHLIIIPKAGHAANLEQPQVFNDHLLRILK